MLTERERFLQTLFFGNPDRIPLPPGGPRESTLAVWHAQGLPVDVHWYDHLMSLLGIERPLTKPRADPGISFIMIPIFKEKVLTHRDGHYLVQDWMGAITEISDKFDYTYIRTAKDFVTRKWHAFPVKTPLAKGGDVMRAELMRVIPPLLATGGFIPGCDHGVPPDISWPNFVEYTRLLAQLTGWL